MLSHPTTTVPGLGVQPTPGFDDGFLCLCAVEQYTFRYDIR